MTNKEYQKRLDVRLRKAAWRRNKYETNPEFREMERARSREYQRMKRLKLKEE